VAEDYLRQLLATGEVVLIDARQHWMAAIRFALKPILLLLLAVALFIANQILDFDGFLDIINTLVRVVLIVAAIAAVIWLPIDLVRWRSRKYVLTNRRVLRLEGVLTKNSTDSSLEKISDIESSQSVLGRALGYTDLTLYTASDQANEEYDQLVDGLQFKKAVLDAREAIRVGQPLQALPEGFVVSGGTNAASRGYSDSKPAEPATAPALEPTEPAAPVQPEAPTAADDDSKPAG